MRATFEVCGSDLGGGRRLEIGSPRLHNSVEFCPVYYGAEQVGAGLYAKAANGLLIITIDLWRTFETQLVALGQKAKDLYLSPEFTVCRMALFEGQLVIMEAEFARLILSEIKYYSAGKAMLMLDFADMENYK